MTPLRRARRLALTGSVPWIFVTATLAIQLGVLAAVPASARPVVSMVLLALWVVGLCVAVWAVSRRRPDTDVPPDQWSGTGSSGGEQAPSPQMQAAWRLARAGATAAQVAEAADLPLALAELMVDDARRNPPVR